MGWIETEVRTVGEIRIPGQSKPGMPHIVSGKLLLCVQDEMLLHVALGYSPPHTKCL
jgi:hypothetical protein